MRDFIYVKDAAAVTLSFLEDRKTGGLFNCGSGKARTWKDLVTAVFHAIGAPVNIEFIEMPENLRGKYQYFTEAKMEKLQGANHRLPSYSLEDAVTDYVESYLRKTGHE
jgi:ADP-L-glycero-D-manno-heptose 6-epimerase